VSPREDPRRRLERLTQSALAGLPLRRAPASLERRVIEAIEDPAARAARQQSARRRSVARGGFACWPVSLRAALVACCLASVLGVLLGLEALAVEFARLPADSSIGGAVHALEGMREAAVSLGALLARLVRLIPPEWLLGGLLATAIVYSALFALVAIAYSALYATPERSPP
jgi:hypothetical protein